MNKIDHVEVVVNKKHTNWNPEVVRRTEDTADRRGLYIILIIERIHLIIQCCS